MCVCVFFFFQAEDGIRDLVRSRGLGDVYKRQGLLPGGRVPWLAAFRDPFFDVLHEALIGDGGGTAVSYTHLTLPTSDLV